MKYKKTEGEKSLFLQHNLDCQPYWTLTWGMIWVCGLQNCILCLYVIVYFCLVFSCRNLTCNYYNRLQARAATEVGHSLLFRRRGGLLSALPLLQAAWVLPQSRLFDTQNLSFTVVWSNLWFNSTYGDVWVSLCCIHLSQWVVVTLHITLLSTSTHIISTSLSMLPLCLWAILHEVYVWNEGTRSIWNSFSKLLFVITVVFG